VGVFQSGSGLLLEPVKGSQAVARVGVTELVGQPGEAVERQEVGPGPARQDPGRDAKILPAGPAEDFSAGGQEGGRA
jgi:hypothetical protein